MSSAPNSSGNSLERRRDRIIKTFGSRLSFVKEQGIYEKLKGTGLAPEMLLAQDGVIELRYVEGQNFYEYFLSAGTDPGRQAECFEMFFSWYGRYREATKIAIGEIDFEDFIIADGKLLCLDFEHCKPGSVEEDIARLACLLALYPKGYTAAGLESAKLFVCVGSSFIDWQPDMLAKAIPAAAEELEAKYGLKNQRAMSLYLAAYCTTAGVVLAGGKSSRMHQDKRQMEVDGRTMLEASTALIAAMPRRIISVARDEKAEFPGFETVRDERTDIGPIEGMVRALRVSDQSWTLFLTCDMPLLTHKLLRLFLSYPKGEVDAFMFEVGGKKQTFPLLLRTENAVRALQEAVEKDERKVQAAIEKRLKIKTIKAEDFKEFVPSMLWNINTPEDYEEITR